MAIQAAPTKGNLINTKKSLELAEVGYELLDKKRNILIREMMTLIDRANVIQEKIDVAYSEAYKELQRANITLGFCEEIADCVPIDDTITLGYRSVMGVEIPILGTTQAEDNSLYYGLNSTNSILDETYFQFNEVKRLTIELAEIENSVYRLADAIKKTQKRANALKNIVIPRFSESVKYITDALDEKDREEFSRLKVIKQQKK